MKTIVKILNSFYKKSNKDINKIMKNLTIMELDQLALAEDIPKACFNFLKTINNSDIQQSLAINESTPVAILEDIFKKSKSLKVLKSLAENKNTPIKILKTFCIQPAIVPSVCKNESINDKLCQIIIDTDYLFFPELLANSLISSSVLDKVIIKVELHLSTNKIKDDYNYHQIIKGLLNHPKLTQKQLKYIFKLQYTKKIIARFCPKINKKMYMEFLKEKNKQLNEEMLDNRDTPSWVLFYLSNDFPDKVKNHPNYKNDASEILKLLNK
jgi:hypothetical protein